MNGLTSFSVRYPITVLMGILGVLVLGYIAYDRLSIDLFPDLNNPRIYAEIQTDDRPPEEIEERYVRAMESLAIRKRGVTGVSTRVRTGAARMTVTYTWDTDMDEAFLDLQKSLSILTQDENVEEVTLTQYDPNTDPVMLIGFSHAEITDLDALRKIAANYVSNELVRLEGIAAVEIVGGEEKEVLVEIDPLQLEAYDLTLAEIATRIESANINASGGTVLDQGLSYVVKGVGEFTDLDDLRQVVIRRVDPAESAQQGETAQDKDPVLLQLGDIARVSFRADDPENMVRVDGQQSLALAIYKETAYNTVRAAAAIEDALAELRRALPGYQFRVLENQATFIQNAVSEVGETALVGILLAIVVLYIFLRQIGTTAIISIAIPISIIATFNLMFFNGLTLNIMTLGGLALGAGMLVDNAIVVMENIFRHLENGRPLFEAAQQGAAEVGGAISASTFTTIIVFLPIVYLQGAAGELFKDQAWTVAFSLLSSLAVALLVIPMLSARFINVEKIRHNEGDAPYPGYGRFLEKTLSRRGSVLAGALALVLLATALIPFVGSEFMPASDSNRFAIHLRLEEGTELRHTYQAAIGMENVIREIVGEDLEDIYVRVGPSPGLSGSINSFDEDTHTATLTIFLKSGHRVPVQRQIARLRASLPSDAERELTYDASESSLQQTLGITEAPIIVEFDGDELEVLRSLTDQARSLLDSLPEITAMESNFDNGRPEINVRIDRLVAGLNNIDITGVSGQIQDRLEGEEAGDWEYEGEMRGIRVQSPKLNLSELGALLIESNGRRFRLDEVATLEEHQAPREIFRQGQSRTGRLFIQLGDDLPLDRVVAQVRGKLSAMPLPDGYRMRITGEEEQREEAFGSLGFAFLLSIILIYMVLAAQFESLIHPFTIIFSVPLAGVGAVLLFFLLGMPFNMMAFIGIIMLVGIAVNDAIILVDAIRQLRSDGMDLLQSVIAAGQRRFRPILMTSLTTILALLPLTIGFGESANLRSPMALAVIGGLVTSTLLTLVVIPCLYVAFDRLTPGRDASR